jgi:hypothetical protein
MLQNAALTDGEVGDGFTAQTADASPDGSAWIATFQRGLPNRAAAGVVLRLTTTTSTVAAAQAIVTGIQQDGGIDGFQATPAPMAPLGTDTVYYVITGSTGRTPVTGGSWPGSRVMCWRSCSPPASTSTARRSAWPSSSSRSSPRRWAGRSGART